jgi:hypothetical protein
VATRPVAAAAVAARKLRRVGKMIRFSVSVAGIAGTDWLQFPIWPQKNNKRRHPNISFIFSYVLQNFDEVFHNEINSPSQAAFAALAPFFHALLATTLPLFNVQPTFLIKNP